LPNVGPYIYDVSISGFTRSSIYIHDISSLRVKMQPTDKFTGLLKSRQSLELQNLLGHFRGLILKQLKQFY